MSTSTAPTKDEIAALTGSDLDDAIAAAEIDTTTGGSKSDGGLTASEKRDALNEHYGHSTDEPSPGAGARTTDPVTASEDEGRPDHDGGDTEPHGTDHDGDGDADDDDEPTVEERRDAQLAAGEKVGANTADLAAARVEMTPAEQRAGRKGALLIDGRVDNMSRRDDSDPLFGHFVRIAFEDDEHGDAARDAVNAILGDNVADVGSGDYGVWVDNGELDPETGYPVTCTIMLRDEHSAQIPGVPYAALRHTSQGGRR